MSKGLVLVLEKFSFAYGVFPLSYGLVTEQKKGMYKYFVDLGEGMEAVNVRTTYIDEVPRPCTSYLPMIHSTLALGP